MWSKLVALIKNVIPLLIKKYLVGAVMAAIGVSGGFIAWILGFIADKIWTKEIAPSIDEAAHLADQKKIDDALNEEYQKKLKEGASEKDLISSEADILNGGRH